MKVRISKRLNRGTLDSPPLGKVSLERRSFAATFFAFFLLEWKRFLRPRNLLVWLSTFLIILFFVNNGINQYKKLPEKIQKFNQIQEDYFKSMRNYDEYVYHGIKMLFLPSPCGVLFQNTTVPVDAQAKVDSIVTVQMVNNLKGKAAGPGIGNGKIDFASIVLWLINLFALWYGYESLQTRDFLLSISGKWSRARLFFPIVIPRFILFTAAYVCMFGCVLLWIKARGIELSSADYKALSGYLLVNLIMLLFFFLCGVIYGTLRSTAVSFACILGTLIILSFLVPGLMADIAGKNFPDSNEDYQVEMDKFKIVGNFENRSAEKQGQFDRDKMETEQKIIEEYRNNYFNKMVNREEQLMIRMQRAVDRANQLAVFFPTTFFLLAGNEVSGKGYASYMEFYAYVKVMWCNFVRFWIDRVFYHDPQVMVYFLKGDENIFRSKSRLPKYFKVGVVLNMGIIIILFFISYVCFKKWLHPSPKKADAFENAAINFSTGKQYTVKVDHIDFSRQLLNRFYGQGKGLEWKLTINGKKLPANGSPDFFYIPNVKQIPGDIKVRELLMLFKRLLKLPKPAVLEAIKVINKKKMNIRLHKLENFDKAVVLLILSQLTGAKLFIFIDFAADIPGSLRNRLPDYAFKLERDDCLLIDMVSKDCYWLETHEFITVAYRDGKYEINKNTS